MIYVFSHRGRTFVLVPACRARESDGTVHTAWVAPTWLCLSRLNPHVSRGSCIAALPTSYHGGACSYRVTRAEQLFVCYESRAIHLPYFCAPEMVANRARAGVFPSAPGSGFVVTVNGNPVFGGSPPQSGKQDYHNVI